MAIFLFGVLSLFHPFRSAVTVALQTTVAHLYAIPTAAFPDVSTADLGTTQNQIVALSKQEYAKHPVSYDRAVLAYTQGSKEPWCADYVSWVFKQAGAPFTNPNSGGWRIPGVYTLQEYFQANHRYKTAGAYTPKTGDVAIYNKGQGHTAIVMSTGHDMMTVIGGNENGHLRLSTQNYQVGTNGLVGFGVL